jgi:hypothetical protein
MVDISKWAVYGIVLPTVLDFIGIITRQHDLSIRQTLKWDEIGMMG